MEELMEFLQNALKGTNYYVKNAYSNTGIISITNTDSGNEYTITVEEN